MLNLRAGLMLELQGDQECLAGSQQSDAQNKDCRQPDRQLQPVGRMKDQFGQDGKAANQKSDNEDDKDGRSVAAVHGAEILPADLALVHDIEKAVKKFPLSAGRALA